MNLGPIVSALGWSGEEGENVAMIAAVWFCTQMARLAVVPPARMRGCAPDVSARFWRSWWESLFGWLRGEVSERVSLGIGSDEGLTRGFLQNPPSRRVLWNRIGMLRRLFDGLEVRWRALRVFGSVL
jgi:hypothetical protein